MEAQIFSIGLTFKDESHDHKNFPNFKNFTLSRNSEFYQYGLHLNGLKKWAWRRDTGRPGYVRKNGKVRKNVRKNGSRGVSCLKTLDSMTHLLSRCDLSRLTHRGKTKIAKTDLLSQ